MSKLIALLAWFTARLAGPAHYPVNWELVDFNSISRYFLNEAIVRGARKGFIEHLASCDNARLQQLCNALPHMESRAKVLVQGAIYEFMTNKPVEKASSEDITYAIQALRMRVDEANPQAYN